MTSAINIKKEDIAFNYATVILGIYGVFASAIWGFILSSISDGTKMLKNESILYHFINYLFNQSPCITNDKYAISLAMFTHMLALFIWFIFLYRNKLHKRKKHDYILTLIHLFSYTILTVLVIDALNESIAINFLFVSLFFVLLSFLLDAIFDSVFNNDNITQNESQYLD